MSICRFSTAALLQIKMTFINSTSGQKFEVSGDEGQTLVEVSNGNDVGLQNACGGTCTCGTCAVEVPQKWMPKLPAAEEDEVSLLASTNAGKNVRLGCQIKLSPALEGFQVSFKG